MSELFRKEAVQHATQRLQGAVILATPMSVKIIGFLLTATIVGAVAFAANATYARKATVVGFLVPDQGLIRVTSPMAGILKTVIVHEGDVVKKGEHLAVLDLSAETSSGNVGKSLEEGMKIEAAAARNKAESRLASLQVELDQTRLRLSKSQGELKEMLAQVQFQIQRVQLTKADLDRALQIVARGYMPRREVDARRITFLAAQQELASIRRQQSAIEREVADLRARLAAIPIEVAGARAEEQALAAALSQRKAESEARRLQLITAPVAGRIAALPVTNGSATGAGSLVAVIIPAGGRLEVELLAPSRSIGFVKPGQAVALSLQAFPYQRFGTVPGTVRTVSSTVIAPGEVSFKGIDLAEPVFRIRVTLSRETMRAYDQVIPMQPGMLVSAQIVFDRRSLMQWLFDPIYAVGRRA